MGASASSDSNTRPVEINRSVINDHMQRYRLLEAELQETKMKLQSATNECESLSHYIHQVNQQNRFVQQKRDDLILPLNLELTKQEELNNKLQNLLKIEQNSKMSVTKRCSDLLQEVINYKEIIFNLESTLRLQEDKLKCKESELNTFKNRISKDGNELIEVRKNLETERVVHKEEQITYKKQLDNQIRQIHKQKHDQEILHKDKLELQKTIKDLKFQLNKQLSNHKEENNKLQTTLNIERNSKTALTKRCDDLLTKAEDTKKVIFNLETALKLQEDKLKAQEVELNTFNNKINKRKNELEGNERFTKELQVLDTRHQADLRQILTLKDNLLKAEEKITDLENVLHAYQMEQGSKKNVYFHGNTQNRHNESNLILLKEIQTTKILEAFNGIIDLKKRIDIVKHKSEHQMENDWRIIYQDEVKKLKDENQAMCRSLENVRLNNGKIETLEENYVKLRLKNDDKIISLFKTIENTANHIYRLHRQFTIHSPAKVLLAINRNLKQIKKFEDSNYGDLYQKEQDLLKQIVNELQNEKDVLQEIKKFQLKRQQSQE